ncbi:polyamine aminopropyltransferase [Terasakiella sp. A23]|uniref:polyamine aminopropyltransferase n=1 Tax=Terasakiella sp. FCG-A23 TaxID=3080561 RepID=UPI0029544257|nr:polyamine aminopropyltransferase [Terasakiella sp. A23]MDV7339917.1 polyamine aminopropyltransferase [Terasakiella sp. A23]
MNAFSSDEMQNKEKSRDIFALIYAVFVAGLCSIVYELLIATTVSYFQGDAIKYFSITIGLYMAAMGAGAYLSKFVRGNLFATLIGAETLLGFLGAFSIPALYLFFSHANDLFLPAYYVLTLVIGFLIGLEIPFLTRLLERYDNLRISIAHVLSLDYFGALIATIAFPLVLLPFFGTFKSGLFFGLMNMTIGLVLLWQFGDKVGRKNKKVFRSLSILIAASIAVSFYLSQDLLKKWNETVYDGRIIYSERTRYQQIILNQYRHDLRLYLDGNLQFSSLDEYRYHEALVHVPMAELKVRGLERTNVLFLGGGDGLGVREALKHDTVSTITLVDLDPAVTKLATENTHVTRLNENSLTRDNRVRVLNKDAFTFLKDRRQLYDLIVIDLPDPNNTELARLYTQEFYRLAKSNLSEDGVLVTQSTSPFYARKAFWGIKASLAAEFDTTLPYHASVPSFGDWGFMMASRRDIDPAVLGQNLPDGLKFLSAKLVPGLFVFPDDLMQTNVEPSTLDRPVILDYYLEGWKYWGR